MRRRGLLWALSTEPQRATGSQKKTSQKNDGEQRAERQVVEQSRSDRNRGAQYVDEGGHPNVGARPPVARGAAPRPHGAAAVLDDRVREAEGRLAAAAVRGRGVERLVEEQLARQQGGGSGGNGDARARTGD